MDGRTAFGMAALAVALVAAAGTARAQGDELARVALMAGCWRGDFSGGTIEERYAPPEGGLVLGTTRYFRNGSAVEFELSHIAAEGSVVTLTPYPSGQRSEHPFRMTAGHPGHVVFAAPEHDFPKRVIYQAAAGDSLVARIDGGEGSDQAMEWRMGRIACDAGP